MAASAGAAAASARAPSAAAAGPSLSAPGAAAGAAPGPSTGGQLPPTPTWFAAMVASRWNNQLSLEAEALELFNRGFARIESASDADTVAVQEHAAVFAGCSRAASAAMDILPPQRLSACWQDNTMALGLRLVEPVLVRLARANAPLHVVEDLLALWVEEAERASRLDERTSAMLGSDTRVFVPTMGAAAGSTGSSGQPALEHAAYSADMASVRSAPPEARRVFSAAMKATLEHVHARQNGLDTGAALALHACLALERRDHEAREAVAAAAATAPAAAAGAGQHAAAIERARTAKLKVQEADEVATFRVLAARRGAGAAVLPEELPGASSGMHESDEWESMPGAMSGEAGPGDLALAGLESEHGANLTYGRNTCACLPNSIATCVRASSSERMRWLVNKSSAV